MSEILFYEYISEYNITLDIFDYIEIGLWIITIIICAIMGLKFLKDSRTEALNKNFVYFGLFFYLFIAGRICRLIAKFIVGYEYGFFQFEGTLLLLAIGYTLFTYIGLFCVYFFLERVILKKTHFIFSFLVIVATILSIINYFEPIVMFILTPIYIVVLVCMPLVFINLARKSRGSVRKRALIVAIGFILWVLGVAFDIPEAASIWITVPGLPEITKFASPILQIVGIILLGKGFPREV